MSEYEKMVRRTFWQTVSFLLVAVVSLLLAIICGVVLKGQVLKISLLSSGALMAIAALFAQNMYSHFKALLTPNAFTSDEFDSVMLKYRKYQYFGNRSLLLLAVLGILVGFCSSLVG